MRLFLRPLTLLACLGVCVFFCAQARAELTPPALAQGKTAQDFDAESVLIIHYRRDNEDYDGWNVWAWPSNAEGAAHGFTGSDAFGLYAVIPFENQSSKIGFIIRKGDWEEKDTNQDRMVEPNKDGIAEIWVQEERAAFDTRPPVIDKAQDVKPRGPPADPGLDAYSSAAPVSAEAVGAGAALILHYHRPDGEYDRWNVWAWAEGQDGKAYPLNHEDGFGRYAQITVDEPAKRIGFIIRKGDWLEREADADRYVSLNPAGVAEVWAVAGEERLFMDPSTIDFKPTIQRAFLDGKDLLHVRLNQPMLAERFADPPGVVQVGETTHTIRQIAPMGRGSKGSRDMAIHLDEPVRLDDVASKMTLTLTGFDPAIIYARDILKDDHYHDLSATLGSDHTPQATAFATWSPVAESVDLLLYKTADDTEPYQAVSMSKGHGSVWRARVEGDLHGVYYMYRFNSYGQQRTVPDIYCHAATKDSGRSMVVDLSKTDPDGWGDDTPPAAKSPVDEVIYEIHVRDYTIADDACPPKLRGKYLGLAHPNVGDIKSGVAHLKELGVTTVHLLPIQDFTAGMDEYNWGYWTALFNVPEAQYSTNPDDPTQAIKDLKAMILALHDNGIRVVMDVVYNHTSTSFASSPFDQTVPWYYFRTTPGGRLRNESGTGNAIADERPMARKYIVDSLKYWVNEYHVDGFRFDLLGMTHKSTVLKIDKELHAIRSDLILYGEPWTGGGPTHYPKGAQKKMNVAVFDDHFRNAIRGDLDGTAMGYAMGGGHVTEIRNGLAGAIDDFAEHPTEAVSYVSAHDNRTLWDKLTHTLPEADEATKKSMHKLSLGLVLMSQGVSFLHGGSEFCRTKLGNHNSYNAGDEVNKFDWQRKEEFKDVFDYTSGLIRLRLQHPALRLQTRKQVREHMKFHDGPGPIWFVLDGAAVGDTWAKVLVVFNGEPEDRYIALPDGEWTLVVNHEKAGTEPLSTESGDLWLRPYSMKVLHQD